MIEIALWLIAVYVLMGAFFAVALSRTPWQDNGWLINGAVWPLYAVAIVVELVREWQRKRKLK